METLSTGATCIEGQQLCRAWSGVEIYVRYQAFCHLTTFLFDNELPPEISYRRRIIALRTEQMYASLSRFKRQPLTRAVYWKVLCASVTLNCRVYSLFYT